MVLAVIIWPHIFRVQQMEARILNALDREKAQRDAVFANPGLRKQLLSQYKSYADFEAAAFTANGLKESGAMKAADMAYRIDKLLDEMLEEISVDI